MTARPMDRLAGIVDVTRDEWLDLAACGRSGVEFVDIAETAADELAVRWCYRCAVIGPCRDLGERLAPHAFRSLFGGRLWERGERP